MVLCRIKLDDNDRAVYCAGDLLKGSIELEFSKRTQLKALRFLVYGSAKCHWTKSSIVSTEIEDRRRCRNNLKEYEGEEVFVNHIAYLFGYQSASHVQMDSGVYNYEFSCHLPPTLPASFDGCYGCIQYHVEALVDSPECLNEKFKLPFTVVRYDDLNKHPDLKIPVNAEEIESFCCFCCLSGPFKMTVTLPYSGFTTRQRVPVTVNFVNQSNVEIVRTSLSLKRTVRYNSTNPKVKTKTEVETFEKAYDYDGVGEIENRTFTKELLLPEFLPNTNVNLCKTVQISYELLVEAETVGLHCNVLITIPITIGTVPLKFDPVSPEASPFVDASAPPSDISPPDYHEALGMVTSTSTGDKIPGIGWKTPK